MIKTHEFPGWEALDEPWCPADCAEFPGWEPNEPPRHAVWEDSNEIDEIIAKSAQNSLRFLRSAGSSTDPEFIDKTLLKLLQPGLSGGCRDHSQPD